MLLELFASVARHDGDGVAAHVARRVAIAGFVGTLGGLVITTVPALVPLVPMEPMRVLQVVYLVFVLIGGGLIGRHVLRANRVRWVVFALALAIVFYAADRIEYRASKHVEWPGAVSQNPWIESFKWVRENAPKNALFTLDPLYTQRSGEDVHGFRAFAERSMLADAVKDQSVAQVDSNIAFTWQQQTQATQDWLRFRSEDFARLAKLFQVDWVLLERSAPAVPDLNCPYVNEQIAVCKLR